MKVLVVDDENIIAEGIQVLIEKANMDSIRCDIANSGKEALQKARSCAYDLLLTDICMPGMSGLELIEEMKKENLCKHFSILSGFSDFEYAQTAIKFGVYDYLLKPVDKKELFVLLRTTEDRVKQEKDLDRIRLEYQLQQALFLDTADMDFSFLPTDQPVSLITVIQTDAEKLCKEDFKTAPFLLFLPLHHYPGHLFLVKESRRKMLLSYLLPIATRKSFAIGADTRLISSQQTLRQSFALSAQAALSAAFFTKTNFLDSASLPPIIKPALPLLENYLRCSISQSDYILWENALDKLLKPIPDTIHRETNNPYVKQILQIVQCRFQEETLSLHTISREIGLNPDYAGKLFKQEIKIGFPEYLNTYRIKELLKLMEQNPSLTFDQAAPLIGFSNVRNLYRVFKRIMNMSPLEYRDRQKNSYSKQ